MYDTLPFYFFSIITLGLFCITVFSKNILYSMSSLAGGMIFISGFYFLLDAEFLGVVQLFVYTGAVLALYAFGMMFFDSLKDVKENIKYSKIVYGLSILASILMLIAVLAPIYANNLKAVYPILPDLENTKLLGFVIFTKYLIPFEVAAIMLLVAMICGIILAGKRLQKEIK